MTTEGFFGEHEKDRGGNHHHDGAVHPRTGTSRNDQYNNRPISNGCIRIAMTGEMLLVLSIREHFHTVVDVERTFHPSLSLFGWRRRAVVATLGRTGPPLEVTKLNAFLDGQHKKSKRFLFIT
jgi:hypothetical protein